MSPEDAFRAVFPVEMPIVTLQLDAAAGAPGALYWDDAGLRLRLWLVVWRPERGGDAQPRVHDLREATVLALPAAFRDDPRVPVYAAAVRREVTARLASSREPETFTDEYWPAPEPHPLARPELATVDDFAAALAAPPGVRPLVPSLFTHAVPRDPAREADVVAHPDDPASYACYADWLLERGDPWGELVVAASRDGGASTADGDPALDTLRARLLGPLADYHLPLRWRFGVIDAARVCDPIERWYEAEDRGADDATLDAIDRLYRHGVPVLRALLALPAARFLRELVLGPLVFDETDLFRNTFPDNPESPYPPMLTLLASEPRPSLRSLTVGGDLAVGLDRLGDPVSIDLIGRYITPERFPNLRELRLHNLQGAVAQLEHLVLAPILPRLRALAVSPYGDAREIAEGLTACVERHAERFAHLDELDLRGGGLGDDDYARLARALPSMRLVADDG